MKPRTTLVLGLFAAAAIAAAGCGPKHVFGLTSDDNNPDQLAKALAARKLAAAPGPANALGKPLVLAVASGTPRKLIAYDAAAGATLWSVDADVQSRVEVAGELVVAREGAKVVVRSVRDGKQRASISVGGDIVGVATDGNQVYVVYQHQGGSKPVWTLAAYGAGGDERWHNDAPGALGAPAAHGGVVLLPFLKQWLSVVDAGTGAQLARIRGLDEEISFVRVASDADWFGSRTGVFRLDVDAASGTRTGSTYLQAKLPRQLGSASYGRDAFDPVQAGYSAFDRQRVLWRGPAGTGRGDGGTQFLDGGVAVHFFRFVFGLTPAGELRWAYSHPRVQLVASDHAGTVLVALAADGTLVALDPDSGAVRAQGDLGAGGQVLGATFDCDGWAPEGAGEPPATVAALVAIARDRDARFNEVKQLAVAALAKLEGPEVTRDLLAIAADPRTPPALVTTVVDLLVSRRDPAGLPVFVGALEPRRDFLTGVEPAAVGPVARAMAALGDRPLTDQQRASAVAALTGQLDDPATPDGDRLELVRALIAVGQAAVRPRLRQELLVYRADPSFASEADLVGALVTALAAGDAIDRETVRLVASDGRSAPAVAAAARDAIAE